MISRKVRKLLTFYRSVKFWTSLSCHEYFASRHFPRSRAPGYPNKIAEALHGLLTSLSAKERVTSPSGYETVLKIY